MGRPERAIVLIGGVVVAVVVIAILVVTGLGSPEPERFPPGTPEAALQQYLEAVRIGDHERIESLLSDDARADIPSGSPRPFDCFVRDEGRQIRVERVERPADDRAVIHLTIEQVSGSGITLDRYSYRETVPLVLEGGDWKIDRPFLCF